MKVILAASGSFALPSLEILASRISAGNLLVISQPDRRRGRGRQYQPTPIKQRALELGLPLLTPENLDNQETFNRLSTFDADFLAVIDYGQLISPAMIALPRQAAINVHPSLLPAHRGPAPIVWSLLRGDAVTGVTTQLLADKVDCGDILLQKKTAIKAAETNGQLTERLQDLGAELLWETLQKWQAGQIKPVRQEEEKATYAPKLHKKDGLLNWSQDAHELERRIRALNPWPGTYTFRQGKRLKILSAALTAQEPPEPLAPGTIWIHDKQLYASCGKGMLQITMLQSAGRPPRNVGDFLRGHQLNTGEHFNTEEQNQLS